MIFKVISNPNHSMMRLQFTNKSRQATGLAGKALQKLWLGAALGPGDKGAQGLEPGCS